MNATYILLICTTIVALLCKDKKPAYLLIIIINLVAWYQGIINNIGLCFLVLFSCVTYIYFRLQDLNKLVKVLLFLIESLCILAFAFHYVPGFFNVLAISEIKLSASSIPFSMSFDFDTTMAALIIYCISDLYDLEKNNNMAYRYSITYTIVPYIWSIALVFIPAYISGYLLFDPGLPDILCIWIMHNFFLVCMGEEIIFRGFLQRTLQNALKNYSSKHSILAIMITSLIFSMAHFQAGIIYMWFASIASFFYGYTYYKTGKILCSMIVHFGLNVFHILLFTYPMAIYK